MSRAGISTPITDALIRGALTRETVGLKLWEESAAETAAGVVLIDKAYSHGDPRRIAAVVSTAITINVPSDVATLQEAIDLFPNKVPGNIRTLINIETGHAPASGITVSNGDWGHIRIESADATVTVHATFTGSFVNVTRATGPQLNCLIDMNFIGSSGVYVEGGNMVVRTGSGCINARLNGLWGRHAAVIQADGTNFSGAKGDSCIVANDASTIEARGANASGHLGGNEVDDLNAVWAINGSTISFRDGDAKNAVGDAVRADPGSTVHALGADVSGAGVGGFVCQGGFMSCREGIANNCGSFGVRALNGGFVNAPDVSANDSGNIGILAINGSSIFCDTASAIDAAVTGMEAQDGGIISAQGSTASATAGFGFRVSNGGILTAIGVTGTLSQQPSVYTKEGVIWDGVTDGHASMDENYAAVDIANVLHAVNTTYKRAAKLVWDTTNNRMLRASGSLAADAWQVVDGSASVVPV